jgi:hypothetical protein
MGRGATRSGVIIAAIMIVTVGVANIAAAQGYPERVVHIIVPATPGSSADILGRMLGDGMTVRLGEPFIIVNKPGANGVIGTADVARASPDGYTLMHGATYSITVQPLIDKDTGYNDKAFTPICQTFKNDQVIVLPPGSPLKTVRNLIDAAKQKPGTLNVGIPGIATIPHLALIQRHSIQGAGGGNTEHTLGPTRLRRRAADCGGWQWARNAGIICRYAESRTSRPADGQRARLQRRATQHRWPIGTGRTAGRGHSQAQQCLYRCRKQQSLPERRQGDVPATRLLR